MDVEKLATQKEVRRKLELENAITTGSVLNRAELEKVMAAIADAFVSRVRSVQGLSRQEEEDLLKELSSWPLALEDIAARQTRLPRGNGTTSRERRRGTLACTEIGNQDVVGCPGLAVGDGVAASCCGKFLLMSSTLSGVVFQAVTRIFQTAWIFQSSASRRMVWLVVLALI